MQYNQQENLLLNKLTNQILIRYLTISTYLTFLRIWICNIQSSKTTCYRSLIFWKTLAYHLHIYSLI